LKYLPVYSSTELVCPWPDNIKIDVPACDGCPTVDFSTFEWPCEGDKRRVDVTADIKGLIVPSDVTLQYAGKPLAQAINKTGDFDLKGTDLFPSGESVTFKVTFSQLPECTAEGNFPVTPCGGPKPVIGPGGGEGDGCIASRWIATLLLILATLCFYIAGCFANSTFLSFGVGFAAAAAVIYGLWFHFCPRPCLWVLLMSWQFSLGAGLGAMYFQNCCAHMFGIGIALFGAGLVGALVWAQQCNKTLCELTREMMVVIAVLILPALNVLGTLGPEFAACPPWWLTTFVVALNGLGAAYYTAACSKP
jgi:hypothetical protein